MFVYVHYVEIVLYCIYVCVFPIYPSMACVLRMSTYILGTSRKRSRLCPFQWDHSADGSRLPRLACTFTSLYSSFLSLSLSLSKVSERSERKEGKQAEKPVAIAEMNILCTRNRTSKN